MKSNKVRMEISRTWHEWFKAQEGETNDERMAKLLGSKEGAKIAIEDLEMEINRSESSLAWYKRALQIQKDNCKFLAGALAVSIVANFGMLVYIALNNGWLA